MLDCKFSNCIAWCRHIDNRAKATSLLTFFSYILRVFLLGVVLRANAHNRILMDLELEFRIAKHCQQLARVNPVYSQFLIFWHSTYDDKISFLFISRNDFPGSLLTLINIWMHFMMI